MLYFLLTRDRLQVNVQHDRNPVFVQLSDGSMRNGYTIKILNMIAEPRVINIAIDGLPGASLKVAEIEGAEGRSVSIPVDPDQVRAIHLFVSQSQRMIKAGATPFKIIASDLQSFEIRYL